MPEESGEVTETQLLAAAQEYDAAVEAGESPNVEIETEVLIEEKTPQEEPEPDLEPDGKADNEIPDIGDVDEVEESAEAETPEAEETPKKSKWKKNEARKSSSWKKINEAKESIKAREEELESRAKELEVRQKKIDEGHSHRDEYGFTAEDYERSAEMAKEEGNPEEARDAEERAEKLRGIGKEAEVNSKAEEFKKAFENTRQELMREIPDLKDKDSDLTKEANVVLREYPDLLYVAEGKGLRHAVQIAQWKMASNSVDAKNAEVKDLTDKLNKLEKKLSVDGGFSGEKLEGEKGFDDLSDKEQEAYLLRAAAQLDDSM